MNPIIQVDLMGGLELPGDFGMAVKDGFGRYAHATDSDRRVGGYVVESLLQIALLLRAVDLPETE
jgi:hypothetical protein